MRKSSTTSTHASLRLFLSTGTKLRRPFRSRFRHHGRFRLLRGEQKQRRQVGRDDVVRLLVEPEEVHSGDEDGLRWLEETARQSRFDRVLERKHQVTVNVLFNTHLISYTNTCSSPNTNQTTRNCISLLFTLLFFDFFSITNFPHHLSSIFPSHTRTHSLFSD